MKGSLEEKVEHAQVSRNWLQLCHLTPCKAKALYVGSDAFRPTRSLRQQFCLLCEDEDHRKQKNVSLNSALHTN